MRYHERIVRLYRVGTRRVQRAAFIACLVTALVGSSAACRAFADYDYAEPDRLSSTDGLDELPAGEGFSLDASGDDSQSSDLFTGEGPQHDLLGDAPSGSCGSAVPTSLVARYTFDNVDFTAKPPVAHATPTTAPSAKLVGAGIASILGPQGCRKGLVFKSTVKPRSPLEWRHVEIPSSPAVEQLTTGSIELWVKFEGPDKVFQGILSRDARGQTRGGHLSLFRLPHSVLAVRLQAQARPLDPPDPQHPYTSSIACAGGVSSNTWHHVVITFGPARRGPQSAPNEPDDLEIYVDGTRGRDTTSTGSWLDCAEGVNNTEKAGISENQEPWILGASAEKKEEGGPGPLNNPFLGAIDELRIYNTRILP